MKQLKTFTLFSFRLAKDPEIFVRSLGRNLASQRSAQRPSKIMSIYCPGAYPIHCRRITEISPRFLGNNRFEAGAKSVV
jgi:hypothetical protein